MGCGQTFGAVPYPNPTFFTFGPITNNCAVIATFVPMSSIGSATHTIYLTADNTGSGTSAGGSISPSAYVAEGSGVSVGFAVVPNPGYSASVGGDCGSQSIGGVFYTTNPITTNCIVKATFTKQ
jgi:hypothetical protein